jgi:glycosyltransferase involved in cell wall biosynthesis
MNKVTILLSGALDFGTVGRHIISFIETLSIDKNNEIFIDVNYCDFNNKEVASYIKQKIKNKNIKLSSDKSDDFLYDFLIFTDAISLSYHSFIVAKSLTKKAKIKICYPVFDGTFPPLEWVKIINEHFDLCLSPSRYCAYNLKRHGVKIDCFGLHCTILNEELLKLDIDYNEKKKFRFGFVGSNDKRKNISYIIQAFGEVFADNDDVELFIHSSYGYDFTYEKEIEEKLNKYKNKSNIIFNKGYISQKELFDTIKTFDSYIYPQTTTGYFTTPAEMLSYGIPIAISDIPVHLELLDYIDEKNNIFFIEHKIPKPIFHPALDYRCCGVQLDCEINSIANQIKNIYGNRKKLYTKNLIKKRKDLGKSLSAKKLAKIYNNLVKPSLISVVEGKQSKIENNIFFMSDKLYNKYRLAGLIEPNQLTNVNIKHPEENYPSERSEIFQGIEITSNDSQHLYWNIHNMDERFSSLSQECISENNSKTKSEHVSNIKRDKYLGKIIRTANRCNINYFIKIIYYILKFYCLVKRLLNSPKRKLKRIKN